MKNLSVKIIVAILALLFLLMPTKYSVDLSLNNGTHLYIVEKYHFNGTMDVTVQVENGWQQIPLYEIFNPVMVNITNLDRNDRKIVEIPYYYKDFISYRSTKTVPLKYVEFLRSRSVYGESR